MGNILYSISIEDVQFEAEEKIGRYLTNDELDTVRDKLDWGINESLSCIYNGIFEEIDH